MNESLFINLLARNSFSNKKRMISGTTRQANKTIGCRFNNTYTYSNNSWSYSGGQTITATSDSTGYYEIEIPDSLVITNFTFDSSFGAPQDNPDQIETINLAYIGNVDSVEMLLYAFSNLTHVTFITGFNKFKNCPLKTMEGCFRACEKLLSLDFTGLNTDYMITTSGATDGRQRYGFPNCFYNCISLQHLILPKIPSSCYMGGGMFYGCENLIYVSCSAEISNNMLFVTQTSSTGTTGGCPLNLLSMRDILSHLSTTSGYQCEFWDSAWYYATTDSQCQSLLSAAESNGWTFKPTYSVYYFDDCKSYSKFNTSSVGCYLVGIEQSTDTHPCSVVLGQTYLMCNETASTSPHDHAEYRFGSAINLTNATELHLSVKAFTYTSSTSTSASQRVGLQRVGTNTNTGTTTQIETKNDNFKIYVRWIDSNGNTTSWNTDDNATTIAIQRYDESPQNLGSKTTYTLSLPSSGFNKSSVVGFDIMYMKTTDSTQERKKGGWWNSILIK